MRRPALLALVLCTVAASTGALEAQGPPARASSDRGRASSGAGLPVLERSSIPVRILTAIGAAAIGAGVGYFASQLVRGDWDESVHGPIDRPAWAAVGGSIGFAVGFAFPLGGRSRPAESTPRLRRNRTFITGEEMHELAVRTAMEAVRLLRPEWLNERGPHVFGEGGDDTIQIYQDGVRLGGLSWLDQVAADHVRFMRFLDAAQATLRFGAGNSHGAILIVTGVRGPDGAGGAGAALRTDGR